MQDQITHAPRAALALVALVGTLFLIQIGALISNVLADGRIFGKMAVAADAESDKVGATAAEFRVDESGAATYSIPLYAVPGTAGVAPKLSLNYSSQGAYGALGKGWSIGGLSSITRCRATREAGDFIVNGQPTDGSPAPINFTATDRYCVDGQRLVPAISGDATCPAVGGMTVENLRTEIETFQRVCAYTQAGGNSGVAFFTVGRKDGSTSWYGDRQASAAQNLTYNGYVNSTTPGKEAFAIAWSQTRFQDSTGNYIDYVYYKPGDVVGEQFIYEVRFTGKVGLAGQTISQGPYAKLIFDYEIRSTPQQAVSYVAGGRTTQSRRLKSIMSCASIACGATDQARYYDLTYAPSASNSGLETLVSVTECRDSSKSVCLPATTFEWSQAKHQLLNGRSWAPTTFGSSWRFEGFKLGDVDGDGRQDMVWLKDGPGGGNPCATENIFVSWGVVDANGYQSFTDTTFGGCTIHEMPEGDSGAWQLFDYNGDGRDDLFIVGPEGDGHMWVLLPSQGRQYHVFNSNNNLLASVWPAIWANYTGSGNHPQLADLNGDGVLDVIFPPSQYTT
ncbi:MAG: FG-GAP-like repeat-containing protein, partial [Lysobacter sp.]|nr:FG-GAP-like repeat-containing protein [Lysobacter sp.]